MGSARVSFSEYRDLVRSDLYRLRARSGPAEFLRHVVLGGSSGAFQYVFWMRTCRFTRSHPQLRFVLDPVSRVVLRHYTYKYGIDVPYTTSIGSGFYIGHFGGIVVNERAVIGRNCNISQQVTLGQANRGRRKGYPVVGDDVYLGPGAKVVGAVRIGDDVAIGANCVVTEDVPDHAVVVGVPGRVISLDGSAEYVDNTDHPQRSRPERPPQASSSTSS
ncbi:serine O-acetyltransferase [Geodermatophilus sp. URMC 65]